jgi:hypothetical protein
MKRIYVALLLMLASMVAGFAVPAYAQKVDRAADFLPAQAVRSSIKQRWGQNTEFAKFYGMRGSARFKIDAQGSLIGKPEVTVTGGTAAQRVQASRSVQATIQGASPFPKPPNTTFPGVMTFTLPFQFD